MKKIVCFIFVVTLIFSLSINSFAWGPISITNSLIGNSSNGAAKSISVGHLNGLSGSPVVILNSSYGYVKWELIAATETYGMIKDLDTGKFLHAGTDNVTLENYSPGYYQYWVVEKKDNDLGGSYAIRSTLHGKALTIKSNRENLSSVFLKDFNGSVDQLFQFKELF